MPWLKVKAYIQKVGSDKVQEVSFMPMNASDGPHYGTNLKFEEGLGKYNIKLILLNCSKDCSALTARRKSLKDFNQVSRVAIGNM